KPVVHKPHTQIELSAIKAEGNERGELIAGVTAILEKVMYPLELALNWVTGPPLKLNAKGIVWTEEYSGALVCPIIFVVPKGGIKLDVIKKSASVFTFPGLPGFDK